MRGLCLYLLGFAFCRLSDSGLRTADYGPESKSRPCAYPHDLGTSSGCRGSYFYLRGELECCQIVILLLRCGFIHSFDSPRAPSRFSLACVYAYPFPANANARAPAFFLLVFPPSMRLRQFAHAGCRDVAGVPFRPVFHFGCVFSGLSCSI